MLQLKSSDQATFFQSSLVQFWWACVNYSLSFLLSADRSGTRCGLLLLQPIFFRVRRVVRSEMVFCILWLERVLICVTVAFLSSRASLPILLWPLTSTRHFRPHNWRSLDIFCFSDHSLQKMVVRENPRRSAVSDILRPARLAPTTMPRSMPLKSLFLPKSDTRFELQQVILTSSTCLNALSCSHATPPAIYTRRLCDVTCWFEDFSFI